MSTFTYETALARCQETCPFEDSDYERSAMAVYENGLHASGVAIYGSLEDAIADYRADYDLAMHEMAEAMIGGSTDNPAADVLFAWALPEAVQIERARTPEPIEEDEAAQ